MILEMMKIIVMVMLVLCGAFLVVIPVTTYILVLLNNHFRDNTKMSRRP